MEDRYFDHIVGCLKEAHERADDHGWVKVTNDLVYRTMHLLKEQQAKIEQMNGNFMISLNEANSAILKFIGTDKFNDVVSTLGDDKKGCFMAGLSIAMCLAMSECKTNAYFDEKHWKDGSWE